MRGKGHRTLAGMAIAVALAVLGPAFVAVATHTGNISGNEPVRLDAAVTTERGARAVFQEPDGVERVTVEVSDSTHVEAAADMATQGASRSSTGEARATLEHCNGSTCVLQRTWTATLGNPITEGATFEADPALSTARFRGWMRDGANRGCRFDVRWSASAAEPTPDAGASLEEVDGNVAAGADGSLERPATASITIACWGVPSVTYAPADGTLSRTDVVGADPVVEDLSADHLLP